MPKCIIADDSKIIRMILMKIMENLRYEVIEAEDGEEQQHAVDHIVCRVHVDTFRIMFTAEWQEKCVDLAAEHHLFQGREPRF